MEENHQLTASRPIFCSAETENVNADFPRYGFRHAVERRDGIREACPVHMKKHFSCTGELRDGSNLVANVNCSELCRLSNADCARLVRMQFVLACDHGFCLSDVDLAIRAANQKQLRSFGEKFRRTALIGLKM